MAQGSCGWAQFWSETHSRSYGLSEEQIQAYENQPAPESR